MILNVELVYAHTKSFTCKCDTSSSAATLNRIPEKVCVQQAHGGVQASLFLAQKDCCPRVSFNDVLSLHGEYSLSPSAIRQISTPGRNYPYCCFKGRGCSCWRCLWLASCHPKHTHSHGKIRKSNHSRYSSFLSLCIIPFEIPDARSMSRSTVLSTFFLSEWTGEKPCLPRSSSECSRVTFGQATQIFQE